MAIQDAACFRQFIRLCDDAWAQGWHEANGGNLSYRLNEDDIVLGKESFSEAAAWHGLSCSVSELAGSYFLITHSGAFLHSASIDPERTFGVVELDAEGSAWRTVWGLGDAAPSSEFETHLAAYAVALRAKDGADRVVYHAHCPNVIALSTVLEPSVRAWTRALWQCMTECIIVFPQGVGVVPWKVPGSGELAQATTGLMKTYTVCVWSQHGLMVRAESFDEAFGFAQTAEKSAGIYLHARAACGGTEPRYLVNDEQLRAVCSRYGLEPNEAFLD
jgi:rhamnulose-1-phosphate aldolase